MSIITTRMQMQILRRKLLWNMKMSIVSLTRKKSIRMLRKKLFISRSETISAFWEGGRTILEAEIYTSEWRLKIGEHFYIPISFGVKEIAVVNQKKKYTHKKK